MTSDTLQINEIYRSLQGESTYAGRPCVFVRLRGCHLRCHYCDSEYAFKEGVSQPLEEVIAEALAFDCDLIEVTGGEPLLQAAVHPLMVALADAGRTVLLETSGACDLAPCDERIIKIVDVKTPASGEEGSFIEANLDYLLPHDEVKFVICDRGDFDWALDFTRRCGLLDRVAAVHASPVFEQSPGEEIAGCSGLDAAEVAKWIVECGLPLRLNLQQHKFLWDPAERRR